MRVLATITAVLLTGVSLSSCDMPGSAPQQQSAAAAPCNCAASPAAAPAPVEHLTRLSYAPVRHHRRHYRSESTANYRESYETDRSEQSIDTYDFRSSSRASYSQSRETAGYGRVVWVDGYGRGYFNNGPVTVAATMRGKRLEPYHGYDVDCPDDKTN